MILNQVSWTFTPDSSPLTEPCITSVTAPSRSLSFQEAFSEDTRRRHNIPSLLPAAGEMSVRMHGFHRT